MDIRISKEQVVLEAVRYDAVSGLVPVVVQAVSTGEVLMVAYANREALKRTLGTGQAWFWSRSRQEYWRKGATSGNTQQVVEVRMDCDGDAVLYLVESTGPACHTGEVSCFYRMVTHAETGTKQALSNSDTHASLVTSDSQVNPDVQASLVVPTGTATIQSFEYAKHLEASGVAPTEIASSFAMLSELWKVIVHRDEERPNGSYTTYLFEHGVDKIAKKVGEEATEVVIAAKNAIVNPAEGQVELAKESADLLYHLFALWRMCQLAPRQVLAVLGERFK